MGGHSREEAGEFAKSQAGYDLSCKTVSVFCALINDRGAEDIPYTPL
jgi:hypothetical protein